MKKSTLPILYSFRRCPYAMRARMAILNGSKQCVLREVSLKNLPNEMLLVSPKATVPVLLLSDGQVLEESLDIMDWALRDNNPGGWLTPELGSLDEMLEIINEIDTDFKYNLDRYKYSSRFTDIDPIYHRDKAKEQLFFLNAKLEKGKNLFGNRVSLADIAIFPFIRQFANTDRDWFSGLEIKPLSQWLERHVSSDLFLNNMRKWPLWLPESDDLIFL